MEVMVQTLSACGCHQYDEGNGELEQYSHLLEVYRHLIMAP